MALDQWSGPIVVSGDGFSSASPDAAPSLFWGGVGLVDPRQTYRYGADSQAIYGFAPGNEALVLDQVPSTLSNTNITASSQTTTASKPLTLVSSSGAGITVTTTATVIPQTGNVVASGALAIDGIPGVIKFGTTGKVVIADPTKAISRAVSVTGSGTTSAVAFTVYGADLYGYPQTYLITASGTSTVKGTKGFKFITSIVPGTTDASNTYTFGTTDIYEFPLRVNSFPYATVGWNNAIISASTGFVAAITTASTSTTGSVRGTYAVQSASDGTKALQMFIALSPSAITTQSGMFGSTPA